MNLKKLINDWWMSPTWWVQGAHFLLGSTFVMLPFWLTHKTDHAIYGTVALGIYGLIKEAILDPWIEGNKFFWDGAVDMAFLYLGAIVPWVLSV